MAAAWGAKYLPATTAASTFQTLVGVNIPFMIERACTSIVISVRDTGT